MTTSKNATLLFRQSALTALVCAACHRPEFALIRTRGEESLELMCLSCGAALEDVTVSKLTEVTTDGLT